MHLTLLMFLSLSPSTTLVVCISGILKSLSVGLLALSLPLIIPFILSILPYSSLSVYFPLFISLSWSHSDSSLPLSPVLYSLILIPSHFSSLSLPHVSSSVPLTLSLFQNPTLHFSFVSSKPFFFTVSTPPFLFPSLLSKPFHP